MLCFKDKETKKQNQNTPHRLPKTLPIDSLCCESKVSLLYVTNREKHVDLQNAAQIQLNT